MCNQTSCSQECQQCLQLKNQIRELYKQVAALTLDVEKIAQAVDTNAQLLGEQLLHSKVNMFIYPLMLKDLSEQSLVKNENGAPDLKHYLELFQKFAAEKTEEAHPEAVPAEDLAEPTEADHVFGGDYGNQG